jgi:hypothetical protein
MGLDKVGVRNIQQDISILLNKIWKRNKIAIKI